MLRCVWWERTEVVALALTPPSPSYVSTLFFRFLTYLFVLWSAAEKTTKVYPVNIAILGACITIPTPSYTPIHYKLSVEVENRICKLYIEYCSIKCWQFKLWPSSCFSLSLQAKTEGERTPGKINVTGTIWGRIPPMFGGLKVSAVSSLWNKHILRRLAHY